MRYASFAWIIGLAAGLPVSAAADPLPQEPFSFVNESVLPARLSGAGNSSVPTPDPGPGRPFRSEAYVPVAAYSPLNGFYASLIGIGAGGLTGAFIGGANADRCKDRESGNEYGSLCGLHLLFGMGIGAGVGYSLAVPVGGHFRQGLLTRKFAINMAAITVLTGVLAYTDWRLYESYDEASYRISIPLSVVAPHLAAYLIGR